MTIAYPSREFDDAVAAVCHGVASDEQARALNALLRRDPKARDEYILRVELHARLASEPDLFVDAASEAPGDLAERGRSLPRPPFAASGSPSRRPGSVRRRVMITAIAAGLGFAAVGGWWQWHSSRDGSRLVATSKAIAMLEQTVAAQWSPTQGAPRVGAPLEPGWLKLDAGLIEVVFYSGTRLVVEGPAELELISRGHASCRLGKITAEVPPEARGFRLDTPQGVVTDLGTAFGVAVQPGGAELHVFKGSVRLQTRAQAPEQILREGAGALIEGAKAPRLIPANPAAYASLLNVHEQAVAADAVRLERWRARSAALNRDASLRVHFDFDRAGPVSWRLNNVARQGGGLHDATIIGCQWTTGRWPEKSALEFQGVSDRVRLNVPGEFDVLTLAAWVRVQGLDRKLNSLFMCDGFGPGTVHWLIRRDGVLGLTIVGTGRGHYQIVMSPPVLTVDRFGLWVHLAVVLDGRRGRVAHYVDGRLVSETDLKIPPPYRFGTAELGNWNAKGLAENDPFMIRNFSGAMDEFCFFTRALSDREIRALHADGDSEMDATVARR